MSYDLKQPAYAIGPETTDEELVKIANAISYSVGIQMSQFVLTTLESARRIAILEGKVAKLEKKSPHLRGIETR